MTLFLMGCMLIVTIMSVCFVIESLNARRWVWFVEFIVWSAVSAYMFTLAVVKYITEVVG